MQAIVVALLASSLAIVAGSAHSEAFSWSDSTVVLTSSLFTASVASALLGFMVCGIVYTSHCFRVDPDNVAAPLAASVGDVSTLILLAGSARVLHSYTESSWLPSLVLILAVVLAPVCWVLAHRSVYTSGVLHNGWIPVLSAMCISRWDFHVQYCWVPKNGQAGILSKNKNDPRLENWVENGFTTRKQRLLWRRLLQRHCWLRNDSTSTGRNISAASPARHALRACATLISSTVYALQAQLCDSKTDRKIRMKLAGVV